MEERHPNIDPGVHEEMSAQIGVNRLKSRAQRTIPSRSTAACVRGTARVAEFRDRCTVDEPNRFINVLPQILCIFRGVVPRFKYLLYARELFTDMLGQGLGTKPLSVYEHVL